MGLGRRLTQSDNRGLAAQILKAMSQLEWFQELSANARSYVGLIVQQGLQEFAAWLSDPAQPPVASPGVFSVAPRALATAVSLRQTVELIWVSVQTVEAAGPELVEPKDRAAFEMAVLRYSRGLAFAAAQVYAGAAEERGAWDARNEAYVIDAVVRDAVDDRALARAASLGWGHTDWAVPVVCRTSPAGDATTTVLRSWARQRNVTVIAADQAGEYVALIGGQASTSTDSIGSLVAECAAHLPGRPVVSGPTVSQLSMVPHSLAEARAGLRAAQTSPEIPEFVEAAMLLYERALLGDGAARERLIAQIYSPLEAAGRDLTATAEAYLESGLRLEEAARSLYVHANTVRYRIKRVLEVTGRDLTDSRQSREVHAALVLGRDVARRS